MRSILTCLSIVLLALVEPAFLLGRASANAGACKQVLKKTKAACSGNPSLLRTLSLFPSLKNKSGQRKDVQQAEAAGQQGVADLTQATAQCTQAAQECQQTCQQEANQKRAQKDIAGAQKADRNGQQCSQENTQQTAKNQLALAELAQLLAGVGGLLSAMKGGGEDTEEIADVPKPDEEENICDSAEGALLVDCQGQSDPLVSRASINGLTGTTTGAGGEGQALSRPLTGDPSVSGSSADAGAASVGGGNDGGGGFGSSGIDDEAPVGTDDMENGAENDDNQGYIGGGGAAGEGGSGGFSGGGGQARASTFEPYKLDDPLTAGQSKVTGEKSAQLKPHLASGSRLPSGTGRPETGGPFQDNFVVIKKAYREATPSLEP